MHRHALSRHCELHDEFTLKGLAHGAWGARLAYMEYVIDIRDIKLHIEDRFGKRTRRLGLTVYPGGRIVLSRPAHANPEAIERFLKKSETWLLQAHAKHVRVTMVLPRGRKDFAANKARALRIVQERLRHFNESYGYTIGRISIRSNKSRWGSCSRKGDLCFNYKIVHLPQELQDYIVVHELCHRGEFNHSKAFWLLVARAIPEYKKCRDALKHIAH